MGRLSVRSAHSASVGHKAGGASPFAVQTWAGMSASAWPLPPQHVRLSAQSAAAHRLLQLAEVFFLWGTLDP